MEELQLSDMDAVVDRVRRVNPDSRRITRLIKSPSGELPASVAGIPSKSPRIWGDRFSRWTSSRSGRSSIRIGQWAT